ncbi:hypothetical protein [Rhizobacter sp. Root1221]|uniref:hypothetical protein n=1 Tax=Rhizobacter sp. Root1221 TaxID=1736433 RepID=UPI0006F4AC66|nr:hypothetical protein [Rhizobacter sp. Root1221]KQV83115.1 hypothetical protein ASC87_09315 [Rhizobacter sp. Root1221]
MAEVKMEFTWIQDPWWKRKLLNPFWWVQLAPVGPYRRFEWRRAMLERSYRKQAAKIAYGTTEDRDKRQSLSFDRHHELGMLDEEIDVHIDAQLRRDAGRFRVPLPLRYEHDESGRKLSKFYDETGPTGQIVLSYEGRQVVKETIREEQKYHSERRARLIPWWTAFNGTITVIATVAAVYLSFKKSDEEQRPKYPDATTQEHRPATTPTDDASRRITAAGGRASGS